MHTQDLILKAYTVLKKNKIKTAQLDAEIILSDILKISRTNLLINENYKVTKNILARYKKAINRRSKNEPVAYITRKREFWSNDFFVNKSTLIPRPETELMVNEITKFLKRNIKILDIGTGCGCILLSLLKELKFSKGIGLDISKEAIKIAKKNSKQLNLSKRAHFIVADIRDFKSKQFDLIVSNPPYIETNDLNKLSIDIKNHEPLIALNGGIDGLDLIKKVIYKSNELLKKKGILAIEIGYKQYSRVSALLNQNNYDTLGKVIDYNDNIRCIISTKK